MRILVAVADLRVRDRVTEWLSEERFAIDVAASAQQCAVFCGMMAYDLIFYDLDLDQDGEELRAFRRAGCDTPLIALDHHGNAADRTRALDSGADDCISRPLDRDELVSRITAVVRRAHSLASSVVRAGALELDLKTRTARVNGGPLGLSRRQYALLEILTLRKGCIVDRDTIRNHIYGPLDWCQSRTIDVYAHQLRAKIAQAGYDRDCLRTFRHLGFQLEDLDAGTHAGAPSP